LRGLAPVRANKKVGKTCVSDLRTLAEPANTTLSRQDKFFHSHVKRKTNGFAPGRLRSSGWQRAMFVVEPQESPRRPRPKIQRLPALAGGSLQRLSKFSLANPTRRLGLATNLLAIH
jgi:hypothetical protein